MTTDGVSELVTKLIKNYPSSYGTYGRQDIELLIDTWTMALEDFDDNDVMVAFKNFLLTDTRGFPPAVGQIVALIPQKPGTASKILTPGEAWVLVTHAMRNVTYNPTDSFDRLPEVIQQILGGVDALRDLANANEKTRDFEKQRFMAEYKEAVNEAKREARRTGQEVSGFNYRDETFGDDEAPRTRELERRTEWFPGCIEVANPKTGVILYVKYEGYPYGEGSWHDHGGLNEKELKKWHEKQGGKHGVIHQKGQPASSDP